MPKNSKREPKPSSIDGLATLIQQEFVTLRLEMVERFENVDEQLEIVGRQFEGLDRKFDSLEQVVTHFRNDFQESRRDNAISLNDQEGRLRRAERRLGI